MADTNHFKSSVQVQLRFKDIDAMGHVNNANFLSFFELARVHYFNSLLGSGLDWLRKGIILARVEIDYKRPVLFSDDVQVECRVSRLGTRSFDMEYRVVTRQGEEKQVSAIGKSVQVCFDYEAGQSIPMPELWKHEIMRFEESLT